MNRSLMWNELALEQPSLSTCLSSQEEPVVAAAFRDLVAVTETLRGDNGRLIVQFVGVGKGTDSSGIASEFGRAVTQHTREELLYIDATGSGIWAGPDMMRAFRDGFLPKDAALPTAQPLVSWGAVGRLLALAGDDLVGLLHAMRAQYPYTVLDCGVLKAGCGAVPLAPFCQATVLVTESTKTRASEVGLARAAVERAGGRILGALHVSGSGLLPRWLPARL